MQDNHNLPDQSFDSSSPDDGTLWESFDYDPSLFPPSWDGNGWDLEWQGQLTGSSDMYLPDSSPQTWPNQYANQHLDDVNPLQSATVPLWMEDQFGAAYQFQLGPASLATMTPSLPISSPSETSNQSSSLPPHDKTTPTPSPPTSSKKYICNTCQPPKPYSTKKLLKRHRRTHDMPIACQEPGCTKRCAENRDMDRHVLVNHRSLAARQLHFCTESGCNYEMKGFGRKDHLLRHLRTAHGLLARSNDA